MSLWNSILSNKEKIFALPGVKCSVTSGFGGGEELRGEPFFLSPAAHSLGTGCVNQGCKEGSLGFHHHIICRNKTLLH